MKDKESERLSAEAWEFYAWVKGEIGIQAIMSAHRVEQAQAYRYCRDPRRAETNNAARTPIDRLRDLLDEAATVQGGPERVRIMLDYLAASIGCHVACPSDAEPDKPTLEAECLDDYPPLSKTHELMRGGEHISVIRQQGEKAHRELDESIEAYARLCGPDGFPKVGRPGAGEAR